MNSNPAHRERKAQSENGIAGKNCPRPSMRFSMQAMRGLLIFIVLNLLASFCFKECGTDPRHTWLFFALGNIFGPLSLIFLMQVYAGMNANVAAALSLSLAAISVQFAFWLAYDVHLRALQWAGILLAITGAAVTASGNANTEETKSYGEAET